MATPPAPFQFLPLGAIIQTFLVGSKNLNIVQSFPTAKLYEDHNSPYFGETIGRIANRVKGAKINSLNGRSYDLANNDTENHLHGGKTGWGKLVWEGPTPVGVKTIPGVEGLEGGESVEFTLNSPDGNEGYPGNVDAKVVYTAGTQSIGGKKVNVLAMEYTVKLVKKGNGVNETAVNVTNHSYFNLSGKPTIEGTELTITTNQYLPIDEGGIPTSTTTAAYDRVTANTPFTLHATYPSIDDCFILDPSTASSIPIDTRTSPLKSLVTAYHPETKIHLEVLSTEPAFQVYTGEGINVPEVEHEGVKVAKRGARAGFCVEPSRYVNAINVPEWKGQVTLKEDETYGSRVVYRGWSDE